MLSSEKKYLPTAFDDSLTLMEKILMIIKWIKNHENEVVSLEIKLNEKEDKEHLTKNRKLSSSGNFTGLLENIPVSQVLLLINSLESKLNVLSEHVGTGYSTNVVDAGYFADSPIRKTYDGGEF